MLKNAPTLAIVAVHTEENEPPRILISNITNIYIHYLIPRNSPFAAEFTLYNITASGIIDTVSVAAM